MKDTTTNQKWTDADLLLFCTWAMDEFCNHTAKIVEDVFDSTRLKPDAITYYDLSVDTLYTLTYAPFDEFAYTSAVNTITSGVATALQPLLRPHPTLYGYYFNDDNLLKISPVPACDSLHVQYYAYWIHPVLDADTLNLPQWAEPIISYRTALHCYTYQAGRNSMVRQWDEKGNREQNPVREHQLWLEQAYYRMLMQYPMQIRRTTYVSSD